MNNPGYAFVLGALVAAAFGAVVGLSAGRRYSRDAMSWAVRGALGFFFAMLAANLSMVYALVTHDFSVKYVTQVGSLQTPLVYTIVSLWSALEGSILLWGVVLGAYVAAFAWLHRHSTQRFMPYAIGIMLCVGVFFALLIAGPANPFTIVSPAPLDGPGPNPLLQNHVLMIIHPPMLYCGYVGMTVPFGVCAGALLAGEINDAFMVPLRRWTMIAWTFLSVGITLGAWWAYAVLGWGGYWSWDPVENASFLPWLTATAFIHATVIQERRRLLKAWTLSLALVTFILTLLGTFMTRSGVFNSVHSFTQSEIGPTLLVFLVVVLVFSLLLLSLRSHLLTGTGEVRSLASRDSAFYVNNLLFVALTFTVLIGTLYPLIAEAVRDVKVSVGQPYFNAFAAPLGVAILFLMGIGPALPWGRADARVALAQLFWPVLAGATTVVICFTFALRGFWPLTTFGLAMFVFITTLREIFTPVVQRMKTRKESLGVAVLEVVGKSRRRTGGYIVHLGFVLVFVAIAASQNYVTHAQATLNEGQSVALGPYQISLTGMRSGHEPRRDFVGAELSITGPSGTHILTPRLNYYERSTDPIGSPAVWSLPHEDVYLSLLAYAPDKKSATLNAWIFPLVGWIWLVIPFVAFGTLIAIWPQRRARVEVEATA